MNYMPTPIPGKEKLHPHGVIAPGAANQTMSEEYVTAPSASLPADPVSRQVRRANARRIHKDVAGGVFEDLRPVLDASVQDFFFQAGLSALLEQMEQDVVSLCGGPKGKHLGQARTAHRHGYEAGFIRLGCARVKINRPRVRSFDNASELLLPAYQAAQDNTFGCAAIEAACVAGVSQRGFRPVAQAFAGPPPGTPLHGLSKSEVGRRFILATRKQMKTLNARRLDGKRVLVLYIDGIIAASHTILAALAILDTGEKQLVGVWEGSSENGPLCRAFLEDLVARGLTAEKGILVVIDGGKGLAAGVSAVLGSRALVQRCRVHKKRNVLEKLPECEKDAMSCRLTQIWAMDSEVKAQSAAKVLALELRLAGYAEASRSLREGLIETLTCQRLGLPSDGVLLRSVSNTNVLESVFATHETVTHRVKRWRHGEMAARWVAAALTRAEKSFGMVGTPAELSQLAAALKRHVDSLQEADPKKLTELAQAV